MRGFALMAHGATRWLGLGLSYLVPNFASLNVISQVAHSAPVGGRVVLLDTAYVLLYAGAVISASVLIFEHRNMK